MANVKISQLPAASTVTADVDVLPIVHSGVTEKVTPNQIVNKVLEAPGEIGGTTPGDATFTTLTAESSVFLNPANADVELSPTGSGRTLIQPEAGAIINPGVLSYMDNVAIGGTTAQAAVFTTLTSNSTATLNGTTIPASKTLVDTDSVQTLSSKYYLNPRIWDWDQNNYYRISPVSPGLATDVYCYLPILTGNDYFSFRNFAETLTNKTISGLSNTLTDIPNSSFQYSTITLGSTSISLGGTASSITGLALTGGTVNNTAIGGTTPAAGAFTTLSSTGNTTLGDASGDTLTINAGTTTFAQGTANGVLYLNGSKVATSGSGLVFDGTNLGVGGSVTSSTGASTNFTVNGSSSASAQFGIGGAVTNYIFNDSTRMVVWANGASTALHLGTGQNNPITFFPNNIEQARLTSKGLLVGYTSDSGLSGTGNAIFSGNVGIGTSSPSSLGKFAVVGGNIVANGGGAVDPEFRLNGASGGVTRSYAMGTDATQRLYWYDYTASAYRMVIDSSGNVGIGTSSPTTPLHVVGTDYISRFSTLSSTDGATVRLALSSPVSQGQVELDWVNNSAETGGGYAMLQAGKSANSPSFRYSAGDHRFSTSGTERLRLDSSGNLGLGVTPGTWTAYKAFQIGQDGSVFADSGSSEMTIGQNVRYDGSFKYITTQAAGRYRLYNGSHAWLVAPSGTAGAAISFTQAMTLDASGNLLVGDTSGAGRLRVKGTTTDNTAWMCIFANSAGNAGLSLRNDGALYTGTLANSPYNLTTAAAANLFVFTDGLIYRATSSIKYKTDVKETEHGLYDVLKLRSVTYKGKGAIDRNTIFGGLIAEEVHDAGLTEFVQYNDQGEPDALAYGPMVSLAFKAIQELHAEIESLKAKVN